MTYSVKPKPLLKADIGNLIRRLCIKIASSRHFDNFIMSCIVFNTIFMTLSWFDEPDYLASVIEIINYTFAAIFTIEAIIKIIAMKGSYFSDSWNIFDFSIVMITAIFLGLKAFEVSVSLGSGATILRALRISRILRLIK